MNNEPTPAIKPTRKLPANVIVPQKKVDQWDVVFIDMRRSIEALHTTNKLMRADADRIVMSQWFIAGMLAAHVVVSFLK